MLIWPIKRISDVDKEEVGPSGSDQSNLEMVMKDFKPSPDGSSVSSNGDKEGTVNQSFSSSSESLDSDSQRWAHRRTSLESVEKPRMNGGSAGSKKRMFKSAVAPMPTFTTANTKTVVPLQKKIIPLAPKKFDLNKNGIYRGPKTFDDHTFHFKSPRMTFERRFGQKPVSFFSLFRFASTNDKILMAIGILGALIGGCSLPVMIVLFGDLANSFVTNDLDPNQVCNFVPPDCCNNGT